MKLTTYGRSLHDLGVLKDLGFLEVILEPKSLSRFGKLNEEEFIALSKRAKNLSLRVILEWDILMTEDVFREKVNDIITLLPYIDALRVQDPGALNWALERTDKPLQFIAENGNHNLRSLQGWVEISLGRIERIVLSIELSKSSIREYVEKISVSCELLGHGRILLFYTPRPLLTALSPKAIAINEEIAALGESEESPHKGFPIVENAHGTFMFHIKEFSLIDFASELDQAGVDFFRIDQRWENPSRLQEIAGLIHAFDQNQFDLFRNSYSQDLMRGFYLVNKTDILFPKLKNSRLQNREGLYVGEVIEAEKGSYLALMVKNSRGVKLGESLKIVHPKGQVIEAKINSLKNLSLEEVESIPAGQVALMQFVGGVWVKSQVFYNYCL